MNRKLCIDRERKSWRKTVVYRIFSAHRLLIHLLYYVILYYIILSPFSSAVIAVVSTALGESRDHCSTQERKIHSLHVIYIQALLLLLSHYVQRFFVLFCMNSVLLLIRA